jgi:hypothetical protein
MTEDSNNAVSNSFLLDDDSRSVTILNYVMLSSAFPFRPTQFVFLINTLCIGFLGANLLP